MHAYLTAGIYPVSLMVSGTNAEGTETKTNYIQVIEGLESITFQDGFNGYQSSRDTRLNSTNPTTNFGTATSLRVDGRTDESTLLFWDLTAIPPGSRIYAADITLNITDVSNASYEIFETKRPWIELEATWLDYASGQNWEVAGAVGAADRGFTVLGSVVGSQLGLNITTLNLDGVAVIQSWVNDFSKNHGFIIQDYFNHSNGLHFASREKADPAEHPKLTVRFLPAYLPVRDPDRNEYPDKFQLHPNFPNPFNPITTIRFDIPFVAAGYTDTRILIYNSLGQAVKTLYHKRLPAGSYAVQWDGTTDAGISAPSGIYYAVFTSDQHFQTEKIVLLK
jgi:PKD repeat protein